MPPISLRKLPIFLFCLTFLWLVLRFFLPVMLPFLLAAVLALAAEPLVDALHRRLHLPRGWAATLGIAIALVITVLLVLALCALFIRELGNLSGILPDLENATLSGLNSLEHWLLNLVHKAPNSINAILSHSVEGIFSNGSALLDQCIAKLLSLASGVIKSLPDSAFSLGTWILASFMISAKLPQIRSWFVSHLPQTWQTQYAPYLATVKKTLVCWLKAQMKLVGVTFGILALGFLVLRIPYSLLWALVVCLVDILPVLGTGTVLIPWSIVLYLQGNPLQALGMLGIYVTVSLVRSVLEPKFVGKQLGLDPLVTLIAIYIGYRFWGLFGMLLSPIFAVIITQLLLKPQKQS